MTGKPTRLAAGIIALCLGVLGAVSLGSTAGGREKAPAFVLPDLAGKKIALADVVKDNKVTVLNFWGIWCPYCVREMPELVSFYKAHRNRGLALLAVDYGDQADRVRAYAAEHKLPFPVVLGDQKVINSYNVRGFPTTYLLDRTGVIRDVIVGATTARQLAAKVKPLLKED